MQKRFWIVFAATMLAILGYVAYDLATEHPKYQFIKTMGVVTNSTCERFRALNDWDEGVVDFIQVQFQVDGHNETFKEQKLNYVSGVNACLYKVGEPVSVCALWYNGDYVAAGLACKFRQYDTYIAKFTLCLFGVAFFTAISGLYIASRRKTE
jgi:hypothetical protein